MNLAGHHYVGHPDILEKMTWAERRPRTEHPRRVYFIRIIFRVFTYLPAVKR
ncbi:MAG: hypothetical protein JWO30_812 [Fibrobacteres bacterium]|nr:hypothetical protein [Fibrobacterota bacterium]